MHMSTITEPGITITELPDPDQGLPCCIKRWRPARRMCSEPAVARAVFACACHGQRANFFCQRCLDELVRGDITCEESNLTPVAYRGLA